LSASISCKEALAAIRRGERLPVALVRQLGEEQPAEFLRIVIEGLADSFDPTDAAAYEDLMTAWLPPRPRIAPVIPRVVETVYVLSRVTLGSDLKITGAILAAAKKRFPGAQVTLVANHKSAGLFAADAAISHLEADYPRSGPVSQRIEFGHDLRRRLERPNRIVIDPDSRMTQLGLVPLCAPEHYFHFPSRTANAAANLTQLTHNWLEQTFGQTGEAFVAPHKVPLAADGPAASVSLGVGENDSKRIGGDFETRLLRRLSEKFRTIWIDRGVGGDEATRVTAAAKASGCSDRIRFWEGSFAGFTSIISQSSFYAGYDSAGQHAAAASGVPLVTFFAGAPSERFRLRWNPWGSGRIQILDMDSVTPGDALEAV
jgi:ADP-heptose:LPS heptosyltransferase